MAGQRGRTLVVLVTALCAIGALVPIASGAGSPQPAQPVVGKPKLDDDGCARIQASLPQLSDWPRVENKVLDDKKVEARVKQLLAGMTLEEKVGQMTQPEITSITPAEVGQYHIGTVLNGGGAWPNGEKHAAQADWLGLADSYRRD